MIADSLSRTNLFQLSGSVMHRAVEFLLIQGSIVAACLFLRLGIALLRADQRECEANAARFGSIRDMILGRVRLVDDGVPDDRVKTGMVYNRKLNRIEICGRISDRALERTFR